MKVILTIMCVCVIIFGGSCAFLLVGQSVGILILLPLAIVALNFAVLAAIYGSANVPAWPLYVLATIDFGLAAAAGVASLYFIQDSGGAALYGFLPVAIAALKGYLTIQVAKTRTSKP